MRQRSAFEIYLRTGRRCDQRPVQFKFNPWHDPEDGRFTFARQGRYFGGGAGSTAGNPRPLRDAAALGQSNDESGIRPLRLAQFRPNPRVRMRGNGGPPLLDPRTLEDAFPGLSRAPAGTIVGLADNFLDLAGPARAMTTELAKAHARLLVKQIRAMDPTYRLDILEPGGFPATAEGQTNLINQLRLDRAKAFYRRGELRPLQVETLRFLQREVDAAYARGLQELRAGRLDVRLSPQEALGNYVDRQVRTRLRGLYESMGISIEPRQHVQVNRRAPNTSDGSYTLPDSRVGRIAFDVSLEAKTLAKAQVRNFFRSDFQPSAVVIVRPSQLGQNNTYIITKPRD